MHGKIQVFERIDVASGSFTTIELNPSSTGAQIEPI